MSVPTKHERIWPTRDLNGGSQRVRSPQAMLIEKLRTEASWEMSYLGQGSVVGEYHGRTPGMILAQGRILVEHFMSPSGGEHNSIIAAEACSEEVNARFRGLGLAAITPGELL